MTPPSQPPVPPVPPGQPPVPPQGGRPHVDPSHPSVVGRALMLEDEFGPELEVRLGTADCCPAEAHYRAVLPATAERGHAGELLLCGHHARACRERLLAGGARLYDEWGLPV